MKKAIGYVRVSTAKQVTDGVSIDAQKEKIAAWCNLNDYELVHIYEDAGLSGKSVAHRKDLQEALLALNKGMAFVCYSLSRVSRKLEDMLKISNHIKDTGADLISLSERIDTTGSSGRMVFNMLAVINEFERDVISERTKMAMQHLKDNNKVYSHIPYGFNNENGYLVENFDEQQVIKKMHEFLKKGYGHRKIATQLNKQNIKSKHGGIWYAKTVKAILDRI
ncbi:recombinase family protein (plasmid) [Acinetobacter defluvii]|uniref:Recombinase family protein n=1 Tax=Acinetobacter defluvii TaxID=1871111 RepID=A0A2S2F8E7_9GAMM|nr:recombinase family protein [Acinetobacter defluvii]AWL27190.1 recombinase family protein [Acinetobacter defluvii]